MKKILLESTYGVFAIAAIIAVGGRAVVVTAREVKA